MIGSLGIKRTVTVILEMCEIRYLDKLVDELARGKAMEKVLRG